MRIPLDIDKLMWVVAESGDQLAVDDFESRFPDLRFELAKRITLVRNFKGARPLHHSPSIRPVFQPRSDINLAAGKKPAMVAGVVLGFAALAAASYVLTAVVLQPRKPAPIPPAIHPKATIHQEAPQVIYKVPVGNSPPTRFRTLEPEEPGHNEVAPQSHFPVMADVPPVTPEKKPLPKSLQPQTFAVSNTVLNAVLVLIETNCDLKIDRAPDMPNPMIEADFKGLTGHQVLDELGKRYGFGVVDEGSNRVLLVPSKKIDNR